MVLKYAGRDIEAMTKVAKAHQNRSVHEFQEALRAYSAGLSGVVERKCSVLILFSSELQGDLIISSHLHSLYETLLEQNLCRIIEPFSRVDVAHIAELMNLETAVIERKYAVLLPMYLV